MAKTLKGHLPVLDGVRGLAVIVIMVYHFRAADLPRWLYSGIELGWGSVDLFFVLSGFLITGILLDSREKPHCLPVFWMRRVLRIFPLFFASLGLLLAITPAAWLPGPSDQRYYWLYLNNWLNLLENKNANHLLGHFWTLAVEEQFYLFWPLVVWVLPERWTFRVAAAGIVLAMSARAAAVLSGIEPEFIYRNTLLRADALLAGAVGACLARSERPEWLCFIIRRGLPAALLGVLAIAATTWATHYHNPWLQAIGHSLLGLGFGCFVLDCALRPDRWRWVGAKPLEWFGKYSYGLYVFHWPVAYTMLHYSKEWSLTGWPVAGAMQAIGFVSSGLLSWTSYRLLEEPMLRMKRHFTLEKKKNQRDPLVFFNSSMSAGTTSKRSPTTP